MTSCCNYDSELSWRLLYSQDGPYCMNLVKYSKINCLRMFIDIETVNELMSFQYNDLKNALNWENTSTSHEFSLF
jgi:hypothetical protein